VLESGVDGPLSSDARESVGGEHLRTLIDDILDLSALETGELKLSRRPLDLRIAAEEVVREATSLARHKGLSLRVEGASQVVAHADRRRVRQILTNLVSNAVKFTPQGSIVVRVARRDAWAHIEVEDTGYGIAEHEQRAIFEAYQQSTDARFRASGAGLGLATVKRLVELHGGAISVSSTVGRGSTFVLQLPLATDEDVLDAQENRVSATSLVPDSATDRPAIEGRGES
jgi:signal transduction histidine kinase